MYGEIRSPSFGESSTMSIPITFLFWKTCFRRFFISLNMLSFEDAKFSLEVIKDLNDLPQETYEKMLNEFEKRKKIDQSWSK